jgi:hypothetical protein
MQFFSAFQNISFTRKILLFSTYLSSVGILRQNFSFKVAEYFDAYGLNFVERVGGTDKSKAKQSSCACPVAVNGLQSHFVRAKLFAAKT